MGSVKDNFRKISEEKIAAVIVYVHFYAARDSEKYPSDFSGHN